MRPLPLVTSWELGVAAEALIVLAYIIGLRRNQSLTYVQIRCSINYG